MATTTDDTRVEAGRRIFARVLAGIDGSQQSLEAARQAALLQDPSGSLTLLAAWDISPTIIGGTGTQIPYYFDEELQRETAEQALIAARDYVAVYSATTGKLVRGAPAGRLLDEIERDEDTLVAVGSSGAGRLRGILAGSVATDLVHRSPCSVLVARPPGDGFPRRIVVGVDGSVESAAAYAAACYLADRFAGELSALAAHGGKGVDERLVQTITDGDHDETGATPAEALVEASDAADLVVVGSRGVHGLRALGSVSERVAHEAARSVLVVRVPVWQRMAEQLGR